jgi:dihydrolipoamide dehydrogenase
MPERYDLVVVGAGPGGYVAALRAAQLGLKVACIDKRPALGGTCLNIGCIPSKALLDSSALYVLTQLRLAAHGIHVGEVRLDLADMMRRKEHVVKSLTDGLAFLFRKNQIAFFQGIGSLGEPGKVLLTREDGRTSALEAGAILLATGSEPASLPALPCDGVHIVTSTEALAFERVPTHLIVVGAGYIGLELGSVWSRLGAKVTVLELLPRILPGCDHELAELLQRLLSRQGLTFHLQTRVTQAVVEGGKVTVQAECRGETKVFQGDKVLVAIGRRPCTSGLGLQDAGVAVDTRSGRVLVDEEYQTNVQNVYAIGDLIAGPMLAHKASEEGLAVAELLTGRRAHVNYQAIPSVVYTHPELASVGLTEEQLQEKGQPYRVGKFGFGANGRARCLGDTEGVVKVLTDPRSDRILGVHILGPQASELIAEAVLAMEFGASAEDLARTCHAHPSLSEATAEAARAAWSTPLHA